MPTIYKHWEILKSRLERYEPLQVRKRIGIDKTVIFRIDEPKYDPNIPVLFIDDLEKWFARYRGNEQKPDSSSSSSSARSKTPSPTRSPPQVITDASCQAQSPDLSETSSEDESSVEEAVCEGKIDRLVISEPIEDEYRKYLDDDIEETVISKNLKKIRTEPVPKQTNQNEERPQRQAPAQPIRPSVSNLSQHSPRKPSPRNQLKAPLPSPPPPPPPPEPVGPNWPEIARRLQQNAFHDVYRDLCHFKKEINSSDEAKSIMKEAVLRCIHEDETNFLADYLRLLYELNYNNDVDFWFEVVMRLKRKLNSHSRVKSYKVKTNPEWVYTNYKRAMQSVSDYARAVDNCLIAKNVSFSTMVFFIDPSNKHNILNNNPNGHNNHNVTDKKLEIKKEVKLERQENLDPIVKRQVQLTRNADGKPSFKISVSRPDRGTPVLRKRL